MINLKRLKKKLQAIYPDYRKDFYIGPGKLLYLRSFIHKGSQIMNIHLIFENAGNKLVVISSKPGDEHQDILDPNSDDFDDIIASKISRFLRLDEIS